MLFWGSSAVSSIQTSVSTTAPPSISPVASRYLTHSSHPLLSYTNRSFKGIHDIVYCKVVQCSFGWYIFELNRGDCIPHTIEMPSPSEGGWCHMLGSSAGHSWCWRGTTVHQTQQWWSQNNANLVIAGRCVCSTKSCNIANVLIGVCAGEIMQTRPSDDDLR